jgi:hypothetical protein
MTWAHFLFLFVPLIPFFFFSWPGCQTLVKQNLKKKKKIVYNLCLTQNNSQKALQKKEKRNIDIC